MYRTNVHWLPALLLTIALATGSSCSSNGSGQAVPTHPGGGPGGGGALELNSPNLDAGATYQHHFTASGTYPYYCIYHTPMTGSVVVSPDAADTLVNVNITSSTASFAPASVKPGGRVVWTNRTNMVHTVTSY